MSIQTTPIPSTSAVDGETIELNDEGALSAPAIPTLLSVAAENALDILFLEADASLDNQDYERAFVAAAPVVAPEEYTFPLFDSTLAATDSAGVKIAPTASVPVTITKAYRSANSTATRVRAYDSSGTLLDTVSFVDGVATFSNPIVAPADSFVRLEADDEGASFTIERKTLSSFSGDYFDATGSFNGGNSTSLFNIQSVEASINASFELDFTPSSCYVYLKGETIDEPVTLSNSTASLAVTPNTITALTFKPDEIDKGDNVLTNGGIAVFFWGGA